jgi:hypothetical protein
MKRVPLLFLLTKRRLSSNFRQTELMKLQQENQKAPQSLAVPSISYGADDEIRTRDPRPGKNCGPRYNPILLL